MTVRRQVACVPTGNVPPFVVCPPYQLIKHIQHPLHFSTVL